MKQASFQEMVSKIIEKLNDKNMAKRYLINSTVVFLITFALMILVLTSGAFMLLKNLRIEGDLLNLNYENIKMEEITPVILLIIFGVLYVYSAHSLTLLKYTYKEINSEINEGYSIIKEYREALLSRGALIYAVILFSIAVISLSLLLSYLLSNWIALVMSGMSSYGILLGVISFMITSSFLVSSAKTSSLLDGITKGIEILRKNWIYLISLYLLSIALYSISNIVIVLLAMTIVGILFTLPLLVLLHMYLFPFIYYGFLSNLMERES